MKTIDRSRDRPPMVPVRDARGTWYVPDWLADGYAGCAAEALPDGSAPDCRDALAHALTAADVNLHLARLLRRSP